MKGSVRCAFILVVALLSGCATSNVRDGDVALDGAGLFGFVVSTNWNGNANPLLAKIVFRYRGPGDSGGAFAMDSKDDLFLASLPAGDYTFTRIEFGSYHLPLDERSTFHVEKGRLTYGGDVTVNIDLKFLGVVAKDLSVADRSSAFKPRLVREFPKTAEQYEPDAQLLALVPKNE